MRMLPIGKIAIAEGVSPAIVDKIELIIIYEIYGSSYPPIKKPYRLILSRFVLDLTNAT
jgi:hypothetical protein